MTSGWGCCSCKVCLELWSLLCFPLSRVLDWPGGLGPLLPVRTLPPSSALQVFTFCCWQDSSLGLGGETDPFLHHVLTLGTMLDLCQITFYWGSRHDHLALLIIKWNLISYFTTVTARCLWNCMSGPALTRRDPVCSWLLGITSF